jgi:hypothetical protein
MTKQGASRLVFHKNTGVLKIPCGACGGCGADVHMDLRGSLAALATPAPLQMGKGQALAHPRVSRFQMPR